MIGKFFLLTIGFFIILLTLSATSSQDEIQKIDKQIEELKNMKTGYEGRATKEENTAQYLQFIPDNLVEAKIHWKRADALRELAQKVQDEIDKLELRKEEILKEKTPLKESLSN